MMMWTGSPVPSPNRCSLPSASVTASEPFRTSRDARLESNLFIAHPHSYGTRQLWIRKVVLKRGRSKNRYLAIESDCGNVTRKRPGIATRPFESLDEERLLFAGGFVGGFAFVLFIFICIRIEELVRVCSFVDVVAIDGCSGVQRLAACLTLGFVSGAGNVQRDGRGDFSVQGDGDFADADGLDRSLELDLATADLEACLVQNLG